MAMTSRTESAVELIKRRQREWARTAGLGFDDAGYCASPNANLPWLSTVTRSDFDEADGREFGSPAKIGKISALHSSSALAVNVFDYWTSRDKSPLAEALGISTIAEIRFERKFETGVKPRSPNIDVVIYGDNNELLAIESKLLEPFSGKRRGGIQDKYCPAGAERWAALGLHGAQQAVDAIRAGEAFQFLDVPQLLKHMLGLARSDRDWKLLLLWYAPSQSAEDSMNAEIARFKILLGPDGERFIARTYQHFWKALTPLLGQKDNAYAQYIRSRYFSANVV
jgi:hypothetical protein